MGNLGVRRKALPSRVIPGILFGIGWSLTGRPGLILGIWAKVTTAFAAFLGAVCGAYLYGIVRPFSLVYPERFLLQILLKQNRDAADVTYRPSKARRPTEEWGRLRQRVHPRLEELVSESSGGSSEGHVSRDMFLILRGRHLFRRGCLRPRFQA